MSDIAPPYLPRELSISPGIQAVLGKGECVMTTREQLVAMSVRTARARLSRMTRAKAIARQAIQTLSGDGQGCAVRLRDDGQRGCEPHHRSTTSGNAAALLPWG